MTADEAIKLAGGVKKLADLLSIGSHQAIYAWRSRGQIPPLRVYQLRELRPKWFKAEK